MAFVFGILLLSVWVMPTDAQRDDFPIGMNLLYITNVFFQYTPEIPEYEITYDFIRWTNLSTLQLEYERDSVNYNQSFLEVRLPLAEQPYLWMDVSTWDLYHVIQISGIQYQIIQIVDHFMGTFGDVECFRLEYILEQDGWENATDLYYHTQLGLLLDYTHWETSVSGNWSRIYSSFVLSGNFNVFNPPDFVIPTTQTTTIPTTDPTSPTSTTSPGQTTPPTTPPTTTPTTESYQIPTLDIVFVAAIFVELVIILTFLKRKE